jgi:hypothetical protein
VRNRFHVLQLRRVSLKAEVVLLPKHVSARGQQECTLAFEFQRVIDIGQGAAEALRVVALELGARPIVASSRACPLNC